MCDTKFLYKNGIRISWWLKLVEICNTFTVYVKVLWHLLYILEVICSIHICRERIHHCEQSAIESKPLEKSQRRKTHGKGENKKHNIEARIRWDNYFTPKSAFNLDYCERSKTLLSFMKYCNHEIYIYYRSLFDVMNQPLCSNILY